MSNQFSPMDLKIVRRTVDKAWDLANNDMFEEAEDLLNGFIDKKESGYAWLEFEKICARGFGLPADLNKNALNYIVQRAHGKLNPGMGVNWAEAIYHTFADFGEFWTLAHGKQINY